MTTLREQALAVLLECNPVAKSRLAQAADLALASGAADRIDEPVGIPGRPVLPRLVSPMDVTVRSVATAEGRAALIHALAHIELNAINLAADACWRFADLPVDFYRDWTRVLRDEARHFDLLCDHLATLGCAYGDLPAHDALWEMAERTRDDVLARVALVPRTLEARGLDASPAVMHKLRSAGDRAGAAIVEILLADEIDHVRIGNRWYAELCNRDGLDPITTYEALVVRHRAPRLRAPFNLAARASAGFSAAELEVLQRPTPV